MRTRAVIQSHNWIWILNTQVYKELHPLYILRRKRWLGYLRSQDWLGVTPTNLISACIPGLYRHNWYISVFFGSLWRKSYQHSESVECRVGRRGAGSGSSWVGNVMTGLEVPLLPGPISESGIGPVPRPRHGSGGSSGRPRRRGTS
jgi:hypothetical protein